MEQLPPPPTSKPMTKPRAALYRAGKTIAQTAFASIGTATLIEGVDWWHVASTSALAGVLSLLWSAMTELPEVGS